MTENLERWPGYDEQSWSERFATLDARYSLTLSRITALIEFGPAGGHLPDTHQIEDDAQPEGGITPGQSRERRQEK